MICSHYQVCQWLFKDVIHYLFSANCEGTINIRICSENLFNFSWIVVAVFPLMVRSGILGLVFVKLLVILQVCFMLLVSSPCKVFCQVFNNCSLIAEYICCFKELMRRRRVEVSDNNRHSVRTSQGTHSGSTITKTNRSMLFKGNTCCLLWEPYEIYTYTLWAECRVLECWCRWYI
jgi:hypothetical protein